MEERYEIRGKLGQGGLGAVYRAYDTRMNREVAIKRIVVSNEDKELEEESTRQLLKEAGALASLQHPHIVTVYDVGTDDDGPFVVMELLSGKSIDELISRAPMTWNDFREFALQTQEALIAAQDLHIVHRDLKPGNIMLNWLPSGKFQVKIVDFGLAKLSPSASLQTMDQTESVFGSIFFMAPEQFERVPLDSRTDMYAIGCVYYYALTGFCPFEGDTGPQVMAAHLQHNVQPIQDVRSEIPLWVCDWIMWHLNRMPADRPAGARESLSVFLENDAVAHPPMSTGTPPGVPQADWPYRTSTARIKPAIPGAAPASLSETQKVKTSPQPLLPPDGSAPAVHTSRPTQPMEPSYAQPAEQWLPAPTPAGPQRKNPAPMIRPVTRHGGPIKPKKAKGNQGVVTKGLILAAALAVLAGGGIFFWDGYQLNKQLTPILTEAAAPGLTALPLDSNQVNTLLRAAAKDGQASQRPAIYQALAIATSKDTTDVDERVLQYITTQKNLPAGVRKELITEVLRKRNSPTLKDDLLAFAAKTSDPDAAAAAQEAAAAMGAKPPQKPVP